MRIEPTGVNPLAPKTVGGPARTATGTTSDSSATVGETGESFAPSGDLAALLAAVRQAPDVRPEVVAAVTAQLSAGALNTPETAAGAAEGLLDSGDLAPQ